MSYSIRDRVLKTLPVNKGRLNVRPCTRADYDSLAGWPPYKWPYDGFNLRFAKMSGGELDRLHEERLKEQSRVTMVAETSGTIVGYIALLQIDWLIGASGNMAVRIHPKYTDKGYGTEMLKLVAEWWLHNGMRKLRLDVAATNRRAVHSYEKVGFKIVDEFWGEASDLKGVNVDEPKYCFLRDNIELEGEIPKVRFYWMEKMRDI